MTEEKGTQSRKRKKWKKDKKNSDDDSKQRCVVVRNWWTRLVSREMAGRPPKPTWCELELA